MQYRRLEAPHFPAGALCKGLTCFLHLSHPSTHQGGSRSSGPGALELSGSLEGARSWALELVCLAPGAAKSLYSTAFKHVLFSAFKIYLYLWPCLTFFTEFPFPFKKRRPRKTEHELQEPRQEVS